MVLMFFAGVEVSCFSTTTEHKYMSAVLLSLLLLSGRWVRPLHRTLLQGNDAEGKSISTASGRNEQRHGRLSSLSCIYRLFISIWNLCRLTMLLRFYQRYRRGIGINHNDQLFNSR